jgi:hypothetical protein
MFWPGLGDPTKRKKTLKFLAITAAIGIGVALASSEIQKLSNTDNPIGKQQCINNLGINYKISATLEVMIDGKKVEIPAKVGFSHGCQNPLYTLSNDGVIYAEWTKKYPFEIGHFLWFWDFPLRDMDETKSKILVNGVESPDFIHTPLEDGVHYKAEFISKASETGSPSFTPPGT